MKFRFVSLMAALLAFTLFPVETVVKAVPPLPVSVYGSVKLNGAIVPANLQVEALIGDTVIASGMTRMHEGDSIYSLIIPGDDPDTSQVEGPLNGEEVHFRVDGSVVEQVLLWSSGTSEKLDLELQDKANDPVAETEPLVEPSKEVTGAEEVDELPAKAEKDPNWYLWPVLLLVLVAAIGISLRKRS